MPKRSIEEISVNGAKGRFGEGFIYSANYTQNYSQSPSQLTLEVVNESFEKELKIIDPNLQAPYSISFGNFSTSMYLLSSKKNVSPGNKTATYTFVDASIKLDRIFVGLINRHCKVGPGPIRPFQAKITCASCLRLGETTVVDTTINRSSASHVGFKNPVICLGEELFTSNPCEIPDVMYNFSQLLIGMNKAGISHRGFLDKFPKYQSNHTGTLREVLSNWCADFGYDFYWDSLNQSIIGIDLSTGINIEGVVSKIERNNNPAPSLDLSSYSLESSKEGTYAVGTTQFATVPGKILNWENTLYEELDYFYAPFRWESIDQEGAILGAASDTARTHWMLTKGYYHRAGLNILKEFSDPNYIFDRGFDVKTFYDLKNKFPGKFVIANLDSTLADAWKSHENRLMAEYGRTYYTNTTVRKSDVYCVQGRSSEGFWTPLVRLEEDVKDDPEPSYTNKDDKENVSNGTRVRYYLERNPTFTPNPSEISEIFDCLDAFAPVYMDIVGTVRLKLKEATGVDWGVLNQANMSGNSSQGCKNSVSSIRTVLAYIPTQGLINFSSAQNFPHPDEQKISDGYVTPCEINEDTGQCKNEDFCKLLCELDPVAEVCRKQNECVSIIRPKKPGLVHNYTSKAIKICSLNGCAIIGYPVTAKHEGVRTIKQNTHYVKSREYFVDVRVPNTDSVMKLNMNTDDITQTKNFAGNAILGIEYPPLIVGEYSNSMRTLKIKTIGLDFKDLPLDGKNGLSSISAYLDENGVFGELVYQSRNRQMPNREVITNRIRPTKIGYGAFVG
jgi:hypothetical protein